jgi:hypothetical protein
VNKIINYKKVVLMQKENPFCSASIFHLNPNTIEHNIFVLFPAKVCKFTQETGAMSSSYHVSTWGSMSFEGCRSEAARRPNAPSYRFTGTWCGLTRVKMPPEKLSSRTDKRYLMFYKTGRQDLIAK